jgi:hypothetical protein
MAAFEDKQDIRPPLKSVRFEGGLSEKVGRNSGPQNKALQWLLDVRSWS